MISVLRMLLVVSRFNKRRNKSAYISTASLMIALIKWMKILYHDRYHNGYFKATIGGMKATNRVIELDQTHVCSIDLSEEIRDDDHRPQE